MSEYLNKDMAEAIESVGLNDSSKEVIRQILMMEKREKNNPASKNEIIDTDIMLVEKNYNNAEKKI